MTRIKPNILLVVMDAVRADSLSCYGYNKQTTPNIDELAKKGVLFENAFSASSWTPPSHASFFTGNYPSRHGVLRPNLYLDSSNITLAEVLAGSGYKTIAFSSPHITPARGFDKGFQEFYLPYVYKDTLKSFYKDFDLIKSGFKNIICGWDKLAFYITQKIKRKIKENIKKSSPFFIYVNYKSTHNPYHAPKPFKKNFVGRIPRQLSKKKIKGLTRLLGREYNNNRMEVSEEEMRAVKSVYDGGVAYLDSILGGLFNFLIKKGVFNNTLIVILADHGDCFGEHHLIYHTASLYDEVIHVPMIMVYPGKIPHGSRIKGLVSLVDVFPTIIDLANADTRRLESGLTQIDGMSLAGFEDKDYHKHIFAERGPAKILGPPAQELKCVRDKDYKYILGKEGLEELYAVGKDPLEQSNIISEKKDVASQYKEIISNQLRPFGELAKGEVKVEEEKKIIDRLRALGY